MDKRDHFRDDYSGHLSPYKENQDEEGSDEENRVHFNFKQKKKAFNPPKKLEIKSAPTPEEIQKHI